MIGGFYVWKAGFQLLLPVAVRAKAVPLRDLALGIQFQQLSSHLLHRPARALLGLPPFSAAQSVQRGRSALRADITRKPVCLMNWDIKQVVIFILDGQIFPLNAVDRRAEQANKLTDTVVHVHDPIPRLQVAKDQFRRFGNHWRASAHLRARPAENFAVGYQVVDFAIFALQHPTTRKRPFNKARLGCIRGNSGVALKPKLAQTGSLA